MAERDLYFYFDYISPYAYLAWHRLRVFAPEQGLRIVLRPTLFAGLLNEHGHKGPAEIAPKRLYMFKDCLRIAARMNVPLRPPASHPFNPLAALRASLLDMEEDTRRALVSRLYAATWADSLDIGSPEIVATLCEEVGVADALARIREPAVKQRLFDATSEAIEAGVFGVPTMIVDDELFWGTDSFPHLQRFLEGTDPIEPGAEARWAAVKATAKR